MASIRSYVNGAGGSSGADLAALRPTYQSGNYIYVGNATAGASDANAGSDRTRPLLTTAQAYANSGNGDTIVYLGGHNETISVSVAVAKTGLSFVGEGTGTLVPRFVCSGAITMFNITGAGTLMDNLYLKPATAVPTATVGVAAAGCRFNALQFDMGANDTNNAFAMNAGASQLRLTNSRFTNVGAVTGLPVVCSVSLNDVVWDNVTFDGGSIGWTNNAVFVTGAITRLRATRIYQLNGSHITIFTGTTGVIQIAGSTGDSRVDWTV